MANLPLREGGPSHSCQQRVSDAEMGTGSIRWAFQIPSVCWEGIQKPALFSSYEADGGNQGGSELLRYWSLISFTQPRTAFCIRGFLVLCQDPPVSILKEESLFSPHRGTAPLPGTPHCPERGGVSCVGVRHCAALSSLPCHMEPDFSFSGCWIWSILHPL